VTFTAGATGNVSISGQEPKISIGGTPLSSEAALRFLALDVDTAIGRPDICEIHFQQGMDGQGTPNTDIDSSWLPGKELKVVVGNETIFEGELTSVDFSGSTDGPTDIHLLAYDKRHRLYRHEENKSFKDVSFQDVVGRLMSAIGVGKDVAALPSTVMPFYLHQGTIGDLVDRLCHQFGLYHVFKAGKLTIKKPGDLNEEVAELRPTVEMETYTFRQTTSGDWDKAVVRGWDPKKKEAIVGEATRSAVQTPLGVMDGPEAKKAFANAETLGHTTSVAAVTDAQTLAKGVLTDNVDAGMQLEATCFFVPKLRAGAVVKIKDVPTRFAGKYRVTSAHHRFDHVVGSRTDIVCRGGDDVTITGTLQQAAGAGAAPEAAPQRLDGVYPALVTKVKSVVSEGAIGADGAAGEIKVKLPQLGDTIETGWLRVLMPGAGNNYGFFVMPEVGDEVLVSFEHGDPRRGYVLGGLYNGVDAAPRKGAALTDGSKILERVWRSRAGHEIALGDKDGAEFVQIKTKDDKMVVRLDVAEKLIKITGDDVTIENKGKIKIQSTGEIAVKSNGDIKFEGTNIELKATANVKIEGGAQVSINGTAGSELKGAKVDINSQGPATVKGNPIMLN
jgi:phage baseplate assembly protein gpV